MIQTNYLIIAILSANIVFGRPDGFKLAPNLFTNDHGGASCDTGKTCSELGQFRCCDNANGVQQCAYGNSFAKTGKPEWVLTGNCKANNGLKCALDDWECVYESDLGPDGKLKNQTIQGCTENKPCHFACQIQAGQTSGHCTNGKPGSSCNTGKECKGSLTCKNQICVNPNIPDIPTTTNNNKPCENSGPCNFVCFIAKGESYGVCSNGEKGNPCRNNGQCFGSLFCSAGVCTDKDNVPSYVTTTGAYFTTPAYTSTPKPNHPNPTCEPEDCETLNKFRCCNNADGVQMCAYTSTKKMEWVLQGDCKALGNLKCAKDDWECVPKDYLGPDGRLKSTIWQQGPTK